MVDQVWCRLRHFLIIHLHYCILLSLHFLHLVLHATMIFGVEELNTMFNPLEEVTLERPIRLGQR